MIELWDEKTIRTKLPEGDEAIKALVRYVYDQRAAGLDPKTVDLGNYEVIEFNHVFEEYNELIIAVKGTSLVARIRDSIEGLKIEQMFRRKRQITVIDYVTFDEHRKDPGSGGIFG